MEKRHEYSNGEITVVWTPSKCIHAGVCVKSLPQVYKVGERPWINQHAATSDELREQIGNCPSAALSFYENKDK
ncbi:MAG: (4Fe-4S)-binding protein [Vicingaceae bacterium]